ncbi:MAG: type II secretion system F family protein [Actinobacteria bacterium]|nr:MAG: type II secretion system F family protein [Actinomycetota bacterium]
MNVVAILLAGLASALVGFTVLDLLFSEERRVSRRLGDLTGYEQTQAAEVEPLLKPFRERVTHPFGVGLAEAFATLMPQAYIERLRVQLVRAGNPRRTDVSALFAYKVVAAAAAFLTALLVTWLLRGLGTAAVVTAIAAGAVAFFAPDVWLLSAVNSRKLAIRRALPDMLDMLTISVEAGLGFDQAVAKLVSNSKGPLAEEFARMLKELQAGIDRSTAYRHLADRTDVPEVATFVTSMVQADVFGISVANVLRTQAKEMRVKRRQHAEEIAQKAPVKIVFPLVLCILPATLIVILGPALVQIGRAFGLIP